MPDSPVAADGRPPDPSPSGGDARIPVLGGRGQERGMLMLLAWLGVGGIALVLVGWMLLAGFLPPPSPSLSADGIARVWQTDTDLKRLGMALCVFGGSCYVAITVAVGIALWRAGAGRVLTIAQTAMGTFGTVFFTLNFFVLAIVAFRPHRPAETTQVLSDLGFSMTFSPVAPFTLQYVLVGVAVLRHPAAEPLIPRWVAYANFWIGFFFVPAIFIPFFKTGPLAWDGVLSFWVPVAVFVAWFGVMFWVVRRVAHADPDGTEGGVRP